LAHLEAWTAARSDSGLDGGISSPIVLPDYTRR